MHEILYKKLADSKAWSYYWLMKVSSSQKLYQHMLAGRVYRREELAPLSSAIDRDLKDLLKDHLVIKPAPGLYYRPKKSQWGDIPAEDYDLVRAFLKTDDFLLTSLNIYNSLPLGLTQLSNVMQVYNRKRVGRIKLGSQIFLFKRPVNFPQKIDQEFLYVDLLNNLDCLPEYSEELESKIRIQLKELSTKKLLKCVERFGKRAAQVKLRELLQ